MQRRSSQCNLFACVQQKTATQLASEAGGDLEDGAEEEGAAPAADLIQNAAEEDK